MDKKYQVFVSSTFRDLANERQDAIRTILDLGHIPAGMELFPASDTEQLSYIKKVIDECDYYVLIMGGRYGSLDENGVSYTEREYDYAVEQKKIVLGFPHGNPKTLSVERSDVAPRMVENLEQFRRKVMSGRLVKEWTTKEQLESLVTKALVRAFADYPATGWVRGDTVANAAVLSQMNELRDRNEVLTKEVQTLRRSLQPRLANLAGLDDSVELHFTYLNRTSRASSRQAATKTLTWREVFVAIGSAIAAPKSAGVIDSLLESYVREKGGGTTTYHLLKADEAIVKNQLVALGLIRTYVGTTIGEGAAHEFMQITESGKMRLAETLAVRSAAAN